MYLTLVTSPKLSKSILHGMDTTRSFLSRILPHLRRMKDTIESLAVSCSSTTQNSCDMNLTLNDIIQYLNLVIDFSLSFGNIHGDEFLVDIKTSLAQFLGEAQFFSRLYQAYKVNPRQSLAIRINNFNE